LKHFVGKLVDFHVSLSQINTVYEISGQRSCFHWLSSENFPTFC